MLGLKKQLKEMIMSSYDEAYANAMTIQNGQAIGQASGQIAKAIRENNENNERNRKIKNTIAGWKTAVEKRDETIQRNNDLISEMENKLNSKTRRIETLVSLAQTWEGRAIMAETAEDSWKDVLREMIDEKNIVGIDKDTIAKKFQKFYNPEIEKRNNAMLSKRQ